MNNPSTVSIPPWHYVHVLDLNTNIRILILGPRTYVCREHERLVLGPEKMVCLTPMDYCCVTNPIERVDGLEQHNINGQARLRVGEKEYRFHQDPFPLYPGEVCDVLQQLRVVPANSALRLRALHDFVESEGTERHAGDEWLFDGPNTYYPRLEVEQLTLQSTVMIEQNTAIKLRATRDCKDRNGVERICGEEWLVETIGAYMPTVYEDLVGIMSAQVLNEQIAVRVRAIREHNDRFGRERKPGDEWLVTHTDADSYICGVDERMVGIVNATTLTANQFCIVINPVDANGQPQLGRRRLIRGEKSFFLMPGEYLQYGIEDAYTLGANEGLVLRATELIVEQGSGEGTERNGKTRRAGDSWLIRGPCEYIPPVGIEVVARRTAIPLGESEGIYVRNQRTGEIRSVIGSTYMLTEEEEHWEKRLPQTVREMLEADKVPLIGRQHFQELFNVRHIPPSGASCQSSYSISADCLMTDQSAVRSKRRTASIYQEETEQYQEPYIACADLCDAATSQGLQERPPLHIEPEPFRVVSLQVPHNAAVQVVDYRTAISRVEFGPTLVLLEPHEQFTLLSLSGGKPKRPHVIKSLYLLLGPDSLTDLVVVETADHARISIQVSYSWIFDTERAISDPKEAAGLFSVLDFVGDTCKTMAARIRGAVASIAFDDFHKNSARIIRAACLGMDENGKIKESILFPENRIRITTVDIQSVAPEDRRTNELLQQTVQMAIEITTNSLEATARHEAARVEQAARGRLERQKVSDEAQVEKSTTNLVEKQLQASILEAIGEAKAIAQGKAESTRIASLSTVKKAEALVEETRILTQTELEETRKLRQVELTYQKAKNQLLLTQQRAQSQLEAACFARMVECVGSKTLGLISNSGSKHEVEMLQALGLRSTLITDGTTPINLLSTASGLIGHAALPDHTSSPSGTDPRILPLTRV